MLSSYWLDTLVSPEEHLKTLGRPWVESPTGAALEEHLYALMAAQDYRVLEVHVGQRSMPVPPPKGWVIIRATAVVEEFEVDVELEHHPLLHDDDGLDDPDEVFDVEVPVEGPTCGEPVYFDAGAVPCIRLLGHEGAHA